MGIVSPCGRNTGISPIETGDVVGQLLHFSNGRDPDFTGSELEWVNNSRRGSIWAVAHPIFVLLFMESAVYGRAAEYGKGSVDLESVRRWT